MFAHGGHAWEDVFSFFGFVPAPPATALKLCTEDLLGICSTLVFWRGRLRDINCQCEATILLGSDIS